MRWTSDVLRYRADPSEVICGGSFDLQAEYVRRLAETFEIELDRPITFSVLSPSALEETCESATASGCEVEGAAYSARPFHFHELAHAVAKRAGIRGTESFGEGLADALDNGFGGIRPKLPIEPVLRDFAYDDDAYYTAGRFVRFVMERHGLEGLVEFLRRTSRGDSFGVVEREFARALGEPLSEAMIAFDEYPVCASWANRLAVFECGVEATPWRGSSWSAKSSVDCSDPDVMGPLVDGRSLVWATRALIVDAPGEFIARTEGEIEGDATVRLTRCGSCWDAIDLTVLPGKQKQVSLTPGRYYVTFIKELEKAGTLNFTLDRMDTPPP